MKFFLLILVLAIFFSSAFARDSYEINGQKYKMEKIFEGEEVIWGMDFISKNELVFTERSGKFKLLNLATKKVSEITGVPKVYAEDQGGLLDVFYDAKMGTLYLTYSDPDASNPTTSLFRGKLSADKKSIQGSRIFQAHAFEKGGIHFGSRVVIDDKGFLFMSVGERNKRDQAQLLTNHQGKILRLDRDGKVPPGNPFIGNKDALPEIWSYGHRNPQGLTISPSGQLLNAEFGPRGGDEINLVEKGANYGWPVITYGREYYGPKIGTTAKEGLKQPLMHWVPSINPSGISFYKGDLYLACLDNHIRRIVLKGTSKVSEEKIIDDLGERFRQVKAGPDEALYLSTDSGKIYKLSSK